MAGPAPVWASRIDINTYLNLHAWYTRGLELGQVTLDSYSIAVQRLSNALAGDPEPPASVPADPDPQVETPHN